MLTLSARAPRRGKVPPKVTPGMRVCTSPVALRVLAGAPIFGSNDSIWLGPPCRNRKITERSLSTGRRGSTAAAFVCSILASDRPPNARLPILRKERRLKRSSRSDQRAILEHRPTRLDGGGFRLQHTGERQAAQRKAADLEERTAIETIIPI